MVLQDGVGFYEKLWMSDPRWRGAPPSQWGCHPSPPLSLQSTNILSRACTHPPPTTTTIASTCTAITITAKHQYLDSAFTPPSSTTTIYHFYYCDHNKAKHHHFDSARPHHAFNWKEFIRGPAPGKRAWTWTFMRPLCVCLYNSF